MPIDKHLVLIKQDVARWNKFRKDHNGIIVDLSEADLSGADLSEANLSHANLYGANLSGAKLIDTDLHGANLYGANLSRAVLIGTEFGLADLSGAKLIEADLRGAKFYGANLSEAVLSRADLHRAKLIEADLHGADLHGAKLHGADLSGADLHGANLHGANLSGAKLHGANLSGADLGGADLGEANLSGAILSDTTNLRGASVSFCRIGRYQLEQLTNYGGLTVGQRMDMYIDDSVAQLRASYSGFLQWVHLAALVSFIFPYAWFVLQQWSRATFSAPAGESYIPLWKALLAFIYNGGINWDSGLAFHWSFLAFLYLAIYNVFRATLLWKTKQLEFQQECSGLPSKFSLENSRWGHVLQAARWMFYIYMAIALVNFGHFFTMQIPLQGF